MDETDQRPTLRRRKLEASNLHAINVTGLHKSYAQTHAVDDVSFDVERGEVFALLGPNGAGKTTTIEILEGFVHRDKGDVSVLGVDPGDRREQWWLRTRIGVVLQELAVESFFTVRQVLERNAGFYPAPRPIDEVLELIGLQEKARARVKTLSGGQQRRLDVGLGIIGNPELVFLDEPTTGLDPAARRTTWELIQTLSRREPLSFCPAITWTRWRPGPACCGAGGRPDRGDRAALFPRRTRPRAGHDPLQPCRWFGAHGSAGDSHGGQREDG